MLDLDFDIEGCHSGKGDRDLVFILLFLHTELERLSWPGESSGRLRVDALRDDQRFQVLVFVVVEIICKRRELVSVVTSLGSVHGDGCLG